MPFQDLLRILLPVLLAAVGAALAGVMRGFGSVRRLRTSAIATGLASGAALAMVGSGIPGEERIVRVLAALALLAGTSALLRVVDLVLWEWFLAKRRHIAVPRLALDLFRLVTLVAVAIAILKFDFGMKLSGLLVTSTVVSAVVGLAIQDMLANLAAGLGLQIEKPFSVGHWLQVGSFEGIVTQMNWRTLTLRTRDSHEVLLPNSTVAKSEVVNFSRPQPVQRLHASVGVAYEHAPAAVKAALLRAVSAAPGVLAAPHANVLVRAFDPSSIHYDVRFYIDDYAKRDDILDEVLARIWYELGRAGFSIAFPRQDIMLRTVSDADLVRQREARHRLVYQALRPIPLFAALDDEQVETLASSASLLAYTRGEPLVHEGETGDSLFVIRSGVVRVEKSLPGKGKAVVAKLTTGDFFGEMSLLTGDPRTASVIADAETEVVVVGKEAFGPVLSADTGILASLTAALESRLRNAGALVAGHGGGPDPGAARDTASTLVRNIRRFFALDDD